ncbi:MAG: VOC family protein, partial [Acidimicrobiales bacterium]
MTTISLVLDCQDPDKLAGFWGSALGYDLVGSVDTYVLLVSSSAGSPKLLLQRVPEGKSAKNRMHLDIETGNIEAEATRLQELGATRLQPAALHEHGSSWLLMADPE